MVGGENWLVICAHTLFSAASGIVCCALQVWFMYVVLHPRLCSCMLDADVSGSARC